MPYAQGWKSLSAVPGHQPPDGSGTLVLPDFPRYLPFHFRRIGSGLHPSDEAAGQYAAQDSCLHGHTFRPEGRQVKPLPFLVPKLPEHDKLRPHRMILAFNKPYGVLSQFTREAPHHRTLAEFGFPSGVYPVGRLDSDSEGLLLLSDEKKLVDRLLNPRNRHPRTYWSQVEGRPSPRDFTPAGTRRHPHPGLPHPAVPRAPHSQRTGRPAAGNRPVRFRANIPTAWLELTLVEGKNRQVRRMTAATGFPTLRLLRVRIGNLPLDGLEPGTWKELSPSERQAVMP